MINRVESIFKSYREFYKIPSIKNTVTVVLWFYVIFNSFTIIVIIIYIIIIVIFWNKMDVSSVTLLSRSFTTCS